MALIALVIVFPLAYSFYLSFQNFDLSGNHLVGQDQKGTVHATRLTVP